MARISPPLKEPGRRRILYAWHGKPDRRGVRGARGRHQPKVVQVFSYRGLTGLLLKKCLEAVREVVEYTWETAASEAQGDLEIKLSPPPPPETKQPPLVRPDRNDLKGRFDVHFGE